MYKIRKVHGKTGQEIVERSDANLLYEQAVERLNKHHTLWLKFGGEVREKTDTKMIGFDPHEGEEVTWTIEEN